MERKHTLIRFLTDTAKQSWLAGTLLFFLILSMRSVIFMKSLTQMLSKLVAFTQANAVYFAFWYIPGKVWVVIGPVRDIYHLDKLVSLGMHFLT